MIKLNILYFLHFKTVFLFNSSTVKIKYFENLSQLPASSHLLPSHLRCCNLRPATNSNPAVRLPLLLSSCLITCFPFRHHLRRLPPRSTFLRSATKICARWKDRRGARWKEGSGI